MIAFVRHWLGQPAAREQDARWTKVEQIEEKLRKLGFGPRRTANACRERLQRLCQLLLELDAEDGSVELGKSTIRRLKKNLESEKSLDESRRGRIQRLEDLRAVLGRLVRPSAAQEITESYFTGLQGWSPKEIPRLPGEADPHYQKRQESLERSLILLRVLAADGSQPEERPLAFFEDLLTDLKVLEANGSNEADHVVKARGELSQSFEDCAGDWEWAYLQVLIRLAILLLEKEPGCSEDLKRAAELLEEAIERLEDKELLQARRQGLFGTLAGTYLRLAKAESPADAEERQRSLHKALTYAQHAVEMEPESIRERLKLLEVLSTLGDYEEMKAEADIALDLDSSSETLKVVGKCFWSRIAALRNRRERRSVLRDALRFFRDALAHVESDPFDSEDPMEQVRAHGWAHFWLGQFLCESGAHDEGAVHLRTARSLDFKPLESRVELAWAYLLGRNPEAEQTFREALEEAERQSKKLPLRATGEERPIDELKLDACLGLVYYWADRDPRQANQKLAEACEVAKALHRESEIHFQAVVHEARGRIALKEDGLKRAVEELEQSVGLRPRSSALCALASVKLQQGRYKEKGRAEAVRQAKEAYRLAHENDVRGRYRRDLADLLRELRQMEKATAAKPA